MAIVHVCTILSWNTVIIHENSIFPIRNFKSILVLLVWMTIPANKHQSLPATYSSWQLLLWTNKCEPTFKMLPHNNNNNVFSINIKTKFPHNKKLNNKWNSYNGVGGNMEAPVQHCTTPIHFSKMPEIKVHHYSYVTLNWLVWCGHGLGRDSPIIATSP